MKIARRKHNLIIFSGSLYHSLSLVVIHCHSLLLDVPLVCLFINDLSVKEIFGFQKLQKFRFNEILFHKNPPHAALILLF